MESNLSDVFEQARQLVAEADRRVAETERRRREIEGQAKLAELVVRAEEAFDFTSREKLELDPRMDVHEDMAVIEFVVRAARAIFVLAPKDDVMWDLLVVEDGKSVSSVAEIIGGIKAEPNSRRLAAARVVASIAAWVEKHRQTRRSPQAHPQPQSQIQGQSQPQIQTPQTPPAAQAAPPGIAQSASYSAQSIIEAGQPVVPASGQVFHPISNSGSGQLSGREQLDEFEAQFPAYEPRDRRASDAGPGSRYEDVITARPAPPAAQPASRPAQPVQKTATPGRASYGTFGKFFGH